jgi:ribosomal protein S18 acetylase RimI-like enzyme
MHTAVTIEKYDRARHNTEEVKKLVTMAIGYPTREFLGELLDVVYAIKGHHLFVTQKKSFLSRKPGTVTGIIGIDITSPPHGWILHLAVHPDYRRQGIGRKLINQVMEEFNLETVALETDDDATDFYHACGFEVVEITSKWPGVRRYRCTKGQPPQSVIEYYNKLTL